MNITIIGGGKLGYNIAKEKMEQDEYEITIIEKRHEKCIELSEELDVTVINGDGTDPRFLAEAGIEDTDIFIVVTGNDEINFVSLEIIKKIFNYEKIIVRVNNPKNIEIFNKSGVDKIVSPTEIMTKEIINILNKKESKE